MVPLYFIALAILVIGLFPILLNPMLQKIIQLYQPIAGYQSNIRLDGLWVTLTSVGWYSLGFILLMAIFFLVRHLATSKRSCEEDTTWGCGYVGETDKAQYTASSFIRTYRKLAEPVLDIHQDREQEEGAPEETLRPKPQPFNRPLPR
jgi:hypothetical protein